MKRERLAFSKEQKEAASRFIQRIREEKTLEGLLQIRKDIADYKEAHPSIKNNAAEWLDGYGEMLMMNILCFDGAEEALAKQAADRK